MYINQIDNLFDGIINNFYIFLNKKKSFDRFSDDQNFVKYMNEIIDTIKLFIDDLNLKEIEELIYSKSHTKYIIEIIKRYCAFYVYLGIAFYYKGDRDLFITNIIETSKNIKDSTFNITNFYNSENNAKIITMFSIIKDVIKLKDHKTVERIKIIINNDPIKYSTTIGLLNSIGEDYFEKYLFVDDNFHNLMKTLIFKQIYLLEEKNDIIKLLQEKELDEAEYKYIDIIVSKEEKLIDFTFLQNLLRTDQTRSELFRSNIANEYYEFLSEHKKEKELNIIGNTKILDFLFSNRIFIPITEDFVRYHKNSEKYDKDITGELKDRDATKIKYIINKINKVVNMYSSIYEKNQKLKLDAMNLFFKALEYKDAVLYNDLEEVKIVNKLSYSENTSDLDYLVDLENMRYYAYLNYKDFSRDGFRLRSTLPVQGVRHTNIKYKTKTDTNRKRKIELRVGHSDIPLNIIGIIYNPFITKGLSNKLLEKMDISKLVDIRTINQNGFDAMYKLMTDIKDDNLYYWMFDTKLDKVKLEEYKNVSSLDSSKVVENILSELFNHYLDIKRNDIYEMLEKAKPNNLYDITKIINNYQNQYRFTTNIPINFQYDILWKYFDKIKDRKIKIKEIKDKDIIKIPLSKLIKKKDEIIILGYKEEYIDLESISHQAICNHYIKWLQLGRISRKNDEILNQAIFDFVKQYVKTNDKNEYICKSCSELLDLKKYVYEGTYVAELDTFLTTNLAVNSRLESLPKYEKYTRTIRNIEKNIEKICYSMNLQYYIGNTPTIKLRRKMIIKDVIDMTLLHTAYLKKQPKNRIDTAVETYGITKDFTNLFFFELKDDIFLTSSMDTDYYKQIKYNNILAYIALMLIADLNTGQILSFKDDKFCNFFIFTQIRESVFSKLFLRLNEKEKIAISNIPLLGYVLFYFACVFTNSYIWLWPKNDKSQIISVQKVVINTIVDLMNTLVEANMGTEKNFQYELIVNRLMQKIKSTYMDANVYKMLNDMIKQKVVIENNKYSFVSKKDKILELKIGEHEYVPLTKSKKHCDSRKDKMDTNIHEMFDYDIDVFTNCPDGRFHEWGFSNNNIYCTLCNTKYNDLIKDKAENDNNVSRVNQIKLLYLRKLASTYCISGDMHDIDIDTNICKKCKINVATHEYKSDELFKLEKNLRKVQDNKALLQLDHIKKYFEKIKERREHDLKILVVLNQRYEKFTENKLTNYVDDFIDLLIKSLGIKIKIDNKTLYLKDTIYIIKNDYSGSPIKNDIVLLSSDNKIMFKDNHFYYKRNVIYYNDKIHGAFVFYDALTKNYLGYTKDNKKFENYKSTMYIEVIHSIRDMLLMIGLEHEYINVKHFANKKDDFIIKHLIRLRCNNLRQIIQRTNSIIEKINNPGINKENPYNTEEFKLVSEFRKSLKNFRTTDSDNLNPIFKHIYTITNNATLKELPENSKINIINDMAEVKILNKLNNADSLLLFNYIYNLTKLIEYNTQPAIKMNICYMITKIIQYNYYNYYIPMENSQLRKFNSLLTIDAPYIDEASRVVGYYQDLVNVKEIDEEVNKEKDYDMKEEENALDIDDYDENDLYEDNDANEDVVEHLLEQ
uniref:Uncharacterized protein n=1 Tax=viral metagenome TaxID=1070528 RepID=A0A6C0HVH9_9ZZZZ